MAASETGLGNCREDRGCSSGGKVFNGRSKNGKNNRRNNLNRSCGRDYGNFDGARIHFAVGEHRDSAFVTGLIRVVMDQFVQCRARGHCAQKQHNAGQQRGDDSLAVQFKMASYEFQNVRFLAKRVPDAKSYSKKYDAVASCANAFIASVEWPHIIVPTGKAVEVRIYFRG
jgi:hypothetical protein